MTDETSFATAQPSLAAEWNVQRNGGVEPADVPERSNVPRWWRCPQGHEFRRTTSRRIADPRCPRCQPRNRYTVGSLADEYPGLADQWDNERNGVPASEAVVLTSEKYWWVCPQGHSWRQYLFNRRAGGPGCPVCSGRLIVAGVNDLATTHPDVAAQWHPDLNGDLLPTQFTLGSRKDAWWLCPEGHAWRAQIRTWRGGRTGYAGCTVCRDEARVTAAREQELAAAANRLARARVPSATPIPSALAAQWHPTKNTVDWPGGITTVSRSSRRSAHWLCDCGHDWYGPVLRRIRVGALGVCPKCGEHWNR